MPDRSKRYILEYEGAEVTQVGSFAGLQTAVLASMQRTQPDVLSIAYPRDEWLSHWAAVGGRREIRVRDNVAGGSYLLEVLELRDTSGDGEIFELRVSHAVREGP